MAITGNLYPTIARLAQRGLPPYSFLQERFTDVAAWQADAAAYLRSLLLYAMEEVALDPEQTDEVDYPEYVQQKWYITVAPGERMPVILLLPRTAAPAPAVLALHGHEGMYYFGKKQLVEEANEPLILTQFRQAYFDGVAIASELARRGYAVAVTDSFYFGERRLVVPTPAHLQQQFLLVPEGSDHWIELLNQVSAEMESTVAKSLSWAGATWPGIMCWDDIRTVDFLLTRREIDAERLGCVGLGMGGFRGALLGALDPRVKAVCVVGWMSTLAELLEEAVGEHSWATLIPGLTCLLDWPDVAGLHAPNPLLVMQGNQDPHFPLTGFEKAAERLRALYAKSGAPGTLDISCFDLPHIFNQDMQRHAWAFLDETLGMHRG